VVRGKQVEPDFTQPVTIFRIEVVGVFVDLYYFPDCAGTAAMDVCNDFRFVKVHAVLCC
jgi:hypothetical protein